MAFLPFDANTLGNFVPTTFNMDVAILQSTDVNSPEFKELLIRLYQTLNTICLTLNAKTDGTYGLSQQVTGDVYFPVLVNAMLKANEWRAVTRKVVNIQTLPNTATKSVAHGINFNANTTFVRCYGMATDPVGLIALPLPYASSVAANNIELNVDATNVNVITGSNRTAFTRCTVVVEFLTQ